MSKFPHLDDFFTKDEMETIKHTVIHRSRDYDTTLKGSFVESEPSMSSITVREPLDCPFCGGTDIRFNRHLKNSGLRNHERYIFSTCCYDCGATFPNTFRLEILVEQWKRRQKRKAPDLSHLPTFDPKHFEPK